MINALWDLMMGGKMELDDPKLQGTLRDLNRFFRSPAGSSPVVPLLPSRKWAWLPGVRLYYLEKWQP